MYLRYNGKSALFECPQGFRILTFRLLRISARVLIYFAHPLDPALIQTGAYSGLETNVISIFVQCLSPALIQTGAIQGFTVCLYCLI